VAITKIATIKERSTMVTLIEEKKDHRKFVFFSKCCSLKKESFG